jgi:hypothetical protein
VLDGEVGDFVVIARQERNTGNWFVGGITDENARTKHVMFDFLEDGKTYNATIYKDGPNAHWNDNPEDYTIEHMKVTKESMIDITMAPGGGFAISIIQE